MTTLAYTIPVAGSTLNSTADPEVATAFQSILAWANGNVDAVNVAPAFAQSVGANQAGQTVKGTVSINTSQSVTSTTFTTLSTPDQVGPIVMPTNGLIAVYYQALASSSVAGAGSAAIFIGANQLQIAPGSGAGGGPTAQSATLSAGGAGVVGPLVTTPTGLLCPSLTGNYSGGNNIVAVNTAGGGGPLYLFAAAGSYTISVQFSSSSGSVTVSNRELWAQALSFA